jgi:MFS family permease
LVERAARSIRTQVTDYREALEGFGHNARRFLVSGFLQGLGAGILATVFGIYIKTAGLGESMVGNTEAIVAASAAVIAMLGTPLIAAFGYRFLLIAAVGLIVGARLGMASLPIAGAFMGFSIAVGLGDGFLRTVGAAFMSENSGKKERSHLFSVEFLVRVSAGLLGGLLGGALPTWFGRMMPELTAYQWTIAIGAVVLGTGIIPMLSLKDQRPNSSVMSAYKDSFRALKQWRRIARLILPQAAISLGGGMVIPFVPLYLKGSLGANIGEIGAILGFSSLVTALGVFGTPVVARKLGLPTGVALLQGLSVPFLAAVSLATSLPAAIGALWIRGALMNMAGPLYNQLAMEDAADKEKPIFAGWMFFGLNIMWLLGNLAGGRLMEVSYHLPYLFAVGLYATGALATYLVWRRPMPGAAVETLPVEALPEAA